MRWWLIGLLVLGVVSAQAQQGRLTEIERSASYCDGVTFSRYSGYAQACKTDNCPYRRQMDVLEALRRPGKDYLNKQGLGLGGSRSEADKLAAASSFGQGSADYGYCLNYFTKAMETCVVHCSEGQDAVRNACSKKCEAATANACERIEPCSTPAGSFGAK